ncbi:MAG TPA: hypothetical protein DCE42_21745 [Myxococcales bacterium]|nr:hypothetical protein [Deltaproteobacteria bacterium]HAA57404.1 hypothetical protein [Myxococcales bacterium]|tara:strand:+ start:8261 stop:9160 length:900 start_codon:yes stop_codon:yes gene_type:complete
MHITLSLLIAASSLVAQTTPTKTTTQKVVAAQKTSPTTRTTKTKAPAKKSLLQKLAVNTAPTQMTKPKGLPLPPHNSLLRNILTSQMTRICIRTDVPPFGYFKGVTLSGFEIALAKELVTSISIRYNRKLKIQWIVIRAPERISSLQKGRCDFTLAAFSKTATRAQKITFSDVYFQTNKVLIGRAQASESPIVALVRRTTPGKINFKNAMFSYFMSYSDILYTMQQSLVDYVITDHPMGLYLVRQSKSGYKIQKTLEGSEQYAVGLAKGSTHLLKEVNIALSQLRKSGRLAYLKRTLIQ